MCSLFDARIEMFHISSLTCNITIISSENDNDEALPQNCTCALDPRANFRLGFNWRITIYLLLSRLCSRRRQVWRRQNRSARQRGRPLVGRWGDSI